MKAITFHQYGSPDVLQLEEVAKPTPNDDEVLVKLHAAATNPLDWHIMRGEPFLAKLEFGLRKPNINILGADIAGIVESVGKNVTLFQVGDAVFGDKFQIGLGGFAEFVAVPENRLALKPPKLAFEAASATPIAGITALQGLREGGIRGGQNVLINGASGGVGTFAVQIAKAFGAEVTGVCSTRNLELVRSIGADHVFDYTETDFTQTGQTYDLIVDAVGNHSTTDLKRALVPNGQTVIIGYTTLPRLFDHMVLARLSSIYGSKTVGMLGTAQPNQDDLRYLADLMQAGEVVPVIDRCYPLEETAEAISYLETSRARGKVVITIA